MVARPEHHLHSSGPETGEEVGFSPLLHTFLLSEINLFQTGSEFRQNSAR